MAREMVRIIKTRTLKGEFAAKGSSGVRARRYSARYAKETGKSTGGPVDLTRTGGMLNSLKGGFTTLKDDGLLVGVSFTTARGERLFEIHQKKGTGKRRIRRRFVFLNKRERDKVTRVGLRAMFGPRQ